MKSFVILFLLGIFIQSSLSGLSSPSELHETIKRQSSNTVVSSSATDYRAFQANWFPSVDPRIIQLVGVSAHKNADNTGTVDAVEFILSDLAETAMFFGYYHAQGQIPSRDSQSVGSFSAAAFAFAIRAFAVFEYVDNNGQPGYQNGTSDVLTGLYDLSSVFLTWKPMDISGTNVTVNGTTYQVFVITIQTQDEVFLMRFVCVGYAAQVEGAKISPTSVKVDFEIKWFGNDLHVPALWTTGPSSAALAPNAQVGMFTVFAAAAGEFSTTHDPVTNKPGVQFVSGAYVGFFEWETSANISVEGVEAEGAVYGTIQTVNDTAVNASFAADWIVQAAYFGFQGIRPTDVAWDPVFGAQVPAPASASPAIKIETSILTVFFAIIALVLAILSPTF